MAKFFIKNRAIKCQQFEAEPNAEFLDIDDAINCLCELSLEERTQLIKYPKPGEKFEKDERIAEALRLIGEDLLKNKISTEALMCINECLCFATETGLEIAFCYAYRSTIYKRMKFIHEWRNNAEMANKHGFWPYDFDIEHQERMLIAAQAKEESRVNLWDIFRLSFPSHEHVPFLAECLTFTNDLKLNRFLFKTNTNLLAGEFIAIVEGVLKISDPLSRHYRCAWCLRDVFMDMIPCTGCPMAMFCSKLCANLGEQSFHYEHCRHVDNIFKDNIEQYEKKSVFFVEKAKDRLRIIWNECATTYKSCPTPSLVAPEETAFFKYNWKDANEIQTEQLLLMILSESSRSTCNSKCDKQNCKLHTIPIQSPPPMIPVYDSSHHDTSHFFESSRLMDQGRLKPEEGNFVGTMINPIQDFFQVGCRPNASFIVVDNKIALMVLRRIEAGENIVVSTLLETNIGERRVLHEQHGCHPCNIANFTWKARFSKNRNRKQLERNFFTLASKINGIKGMDETAYWRLIGKLDGCARALARTDYVANY